MNLWPPLLLALLGYYCWRRRLNFLLATPSSSPGTQAALQPTTLRTQTTSHTLPVILIIPARNEAMNLPTLLRSIEQAIPGPHRIVVVDDHSTDTTAAVARQFSVAVTQPDPLPTGWLGKPWACAAGVDYCLQTSETTADWLLFTDADTEHVPTLLDHAFQLAEQTKSDLVSVIPTHKAVSWWEHGQGVFHLLLLIATAANRYLPNNPQEIQTRASSTSPGRAFSIGQFLLFRRTSYQALGGHAAVRQTVAEDLAFCQLLFQKGGRYTLLFAPNALKVRMYPEGFFAFLRGWRRNFREGLDRAGAGGIIETSFVCGWLLGSLTWPISAWVQADRNAFLIFGGLAIFTAWEIWRRQQPLGHFAAWGILLYPLFVMAFLLVTVQAFWDWLRGAPIRWRGRTITLQPFTLNTKAHHKDAGPIKKRNNEPS